MSDLYWLTDEQPARLLRYFPKSRECARGDNRRVLSGIIVVNRDGLRSRDASWDYGPAKPVLSLSKGRSSIAWKRWSDMGIFVRMMEGLATPQAPDH